MKWIIRFVYTVAAAILLSSFALYVYKNYDFKPTNRIKSVVEHEMSSQHASTGIIHAIAIDMDHNEILNHTTVENGDDAFFVIKAEAKSIQDVTGIGKGKIYVFNGVMTLLQHDKNFDGWINQVDEIFNELELVFFRKLSHERRIVTLPRAGINVLYFNEDYLDELRQGKKPQIGEVIGSAVMSDSSRRTMKIIALPVAFLH